MFASLPPGKAPIRRRIDLALEGAADLQLGIDDGERSFFEAMGSGELIRAEVGSWDGVTSRPHRFGGVAFMLGKRELGHIHGDRLADLPFPKQVAEELIADGRALPHHVVPDSGWVSKPIRSEKDVYAVLALFRLSYDRAVAAAARRAEGVRPLETG